MAQGNKKSSEQDSMPRDDIAKQITLYRLKDTVDLDTVEFPNYEKVHSKNGKSIKTALFFLKTQGSDASWYKVFATLNPDLSSFSSKPPHVQYSGFIYLMKTNSSTYACTGGLGFHALGSSEGYAIEPRFGIIIAKKILNSEHLRGLVQKDSSGILNSLDRVFKGNYNPAGDIENLHRVLTHIRASVVKQSELYKEIGSNIKAGDSLHVSGQKDINGIHEFIIKVEQIWNEERSDTLTIPELDYIKPKYESNLIAALNASLRQHLVDNPSTRSIFFDDMEIGFLPDRVSQYIISRGRNTESFNSMDAVIGHVSSLLNDKAVSIDDIFIEFKIVDGINDLPRKKLTHYICGDIVYDNETYFVISNRWYRAHQNFMESIDNEINEIEFIESALSSLPTWDNQVHSDENDYIYNGCASDFTILHKRLIHSNNPGSKHQKIEFCDLLKQEGDSVRLFHIKHACGALLRDLFSQGYVSASCFKEDKDFRSNVFSAQMDQCSHNGQTIELSDNDRQLLSGLNGKLIRNYTVVFAIYDETHAFTPAQAGPQAGSTLDCLQGTLTLYAKIDLLSRVQAIRSMGYNVALTRIPSA